MGDDRQNGAIGDNTYGRKAIVSFTKNDEDSFEEVKKELLRSIYNPNASAGMKGKMYFMRNNGGKK